MSLSIKPLRKWMKFILPFVIIVVSLTFASIITRMRPEAEKQAPVPNYPKVELYEVHSEPVQVAIEAQGTVQPRQKTRLTARVSGHIEWVSPKFYEGGFFKTGDVLLRLDSLPYESAEAEARSRLALAEATLLQEQEAAEQAKIDWANVGSGEPNPLVLRVPQMAKAEADLEAARISLQMASDNLSYTEIKAPYAGRVQAKHVDVGQAITAQATILGEIFSTDAMEVPVSISLDDLAFIQKEENSATPQGDNGEKPEVYLMREIAGVSHTWVSYLDRTAASVDERSRMITAYARMEPPFTSDNGAALTPGMFVSASIQGAMIESAKRIPRSALHPGDIVYRFIEGDRLESVQLDILRTDTHWAVVTEGLDSGDKLCLTPLLFFIDGMQVDVVGEDSSGSAEVTEPGT
jgi:RND family efflux transporter MFP subunit